MCSSSPPNILIFHFWNLEGILRSTSKGFHLGLVGWFCQKKLLDFKNQKVWSGISSQKTHGCLENVSGISLPDAACRWNVRLPQVSTETKSQRVQRGDSPAHPSPEVGILQKMPFSQEVVTIGWCFDGYLYLRLNLTEKKDIQMFDSINLRRYPDVW